MPPYRENVDYKNNKRCFNNILYFVKFLVLKAYNEMYFAQGRKQNTLNNSTFDLITHYDGCRNNLPHIYSPHAKLCRDN